jgi:MFS transporter, Spinster family, sphingosine-1-phosphate transporter
MNASSDSQASASKPTVGAPTAGQARLALGLLLAINFFNYVDRYVLAAVVPQIRETFFPHAGPRDDLETTGRLATAFIIAYMLTSPIFGWLADRMSRWVIIGLSVILWSLLTGGSGLAATFGILLITRMFVGVGEAGYGPAAPTVISDLYPIERRGTVLAWFYMAIPVGSALGYVLGGVIGAKFGWRMAFFAVTPPGLLLGIFCFFMKDPPRGAVDHAKMNKGRARLGDYLLLLRTPSYVLDSAGMAAMTFAVGGIAFWMPTYFHDVRNAGDLGHVNLMFGAITAVAGVMATLLGGLAGDALRAKFSGAYFLVSAAGIFLCCPLILAMVYLPFPWAWVACFAAEFCLFFNTGPSNTILANVTHPSIRSMAFAANIFLIHIAGDALSPPLLGHVAEKAGWNAAMGLVTGVTALAGVLWLIGAKFLAADTAAALRRAP